MTFAIEHANAADYDELLDLLNSAFKKTPENSFDKALPIMWRHTDTAMGKHLIIRDGKRICATVGVYPLPVMLGKTQLLFGTVGNVATRPEYEGQGMMRALMPAAMAEARALGFDVARLGGQRQRYNRYGFDIAAQQLGFGITRKNVSAYFDGSLSAGKTYSPRLTFRKIDGNDAATMSLARQLHAQDYMHVIRGEGMDFFDVMRAWCNVPQAALDESGRIVGFISTSPDGSNVVEHFAENTETHFQLLLDWLITHEDLSAINFNVSPYDTALCRMLTPLADGWFVSSPSRFCIMNFQNVAQATLTAREEIYGPVPSGRFVLNITDYGTLSFTDGTVKRTDSASPMLTLDKLAATRLLFGQLPAACVAALPAEARTYVNAVFPLPIWWNPQDRV